MIQESAKYCLHRPILTPNSHYESCLYYFPSGYAVMHGYTFTCHILLEALCFFFFFFYLLRSRSRAPKPRLDYPFAATWLCMVYSVSILAYETTIKSGSSNAYGYFSSSQSAYGTKSCVSCWNFPCKSIASSSI